MKIEVYNAKRQELMNAAQTLIDEGKIEDANAKMQEVTALDEQYDAEAKAEADLKALAGEQRKINMQNLSGASSVNSPVVDQTVVAPMQKEDVYKTDEYVNAWAKVMMGKQMSNEEAKAFQMVNDAYTHTTENTPVVIPHTVAGKIWEEIGAMYPFWEDILKTYVQGKVTIIKEASSTDAAWYVESVATADGTELFGHADLAGCELSRAITISWKLKEMAIADFIPYITRKMAEKMGAGLAYGVMNGLGVRDNQPSEPLGIITALKAGSKPQVVEYTGTLTYEKLTQARGLVKSGYAPAVYANSNTIWNVLANVVDGNGRPLFMADAMNGGVYRILGCVVKEDDSVPAGAVLFSDATRGYQANINKDITVSTEDHVKARQTDYCGYAIADGTPLTLKAHALVMLGE